MNAYNQLACKNFKLHTCFRFRPGPDSGTDLVSKFLPRGSFGCVWCGRGARKSEVPWPCRSTTWVGMGVVTGRKGASV